MSFSRQALRFMRDFVIVGLAFGLVHVAKPFLLPVTVAIFISLLLLPLVRLLERVRVPTAIAAGLLVVGFVSATATGVVLLKDPALSWLERTPSSVATIRDKLQNIQEPVDQVARAAEEVESLTRSDDASTPEPVQVANEDSLSERVLGGTWRLITSGTVVAVLVFFGLAYREELYRKALALMPNERTRESVLAAASAVHGQLGGYMMLVTAVNVVLGICVGTLVWALGYSNPVLWGTMAGLLNFVPYLGSMTGIVIVAGVGLVTLDGVAPVAAAAGGYALMTTLEGMVISPALMGSRLSLDPVAIVLGLLLMGFVWGFAGVLLTVPLLVAIKVVADHHPRGAMVSTLLGRVSLSTSEEESSADQPSTGRTSAASATA